MKEDITSPSKLAYPTAVVNPALKIIKEEVKARKKSRKVRIAPSFDSKGVTASPASRDSARLLEALKREGFENSIVYKKIIKENDAVFSILLDSNFSRNFFLIAIKYATRHWFLNQKGLEKLRFPSSQSHDDLHSVLQAADAQLLKHYPITPLTPEHGIVGYINKKLQGEKDKPISDIVVKKLMISSIEESEFKQNSEVLKWFQSHHLKLLIVSLRSITRALEIEKMNPSSKISAELAHIQKVLFKCYLVEFSDSLNKKLDVTTDLTVYSELLPSILLTNPSVDQQEIVQQRFLALFKKTSTDRRLAKDIATLSGYFCAKEQLDLPGVEQQITFIITLDDILSAVKSGLEYKEILGKFKVTKLKSRLPFLDTRAEVSKNKELKHSNFRDLFALSAKILIQTIRYYDTLVPRHDSVHDDSVTKALKDLESLNQGSLSTIQFIDLIKKKIQTTFSLYKQDWPNQLKIYIQNQCKDFDSEFTCSFTPDQQLLILGLNEEKGQETLHFSNTQEIINRLGNKIQALLSLPVPDPISLEENKKLEFEKERLDSGEAEFTLSGTLHYLLTTAPIWQKKLQTRFKALEDIIKLMDEKEASGFETVKVSFLTASEQFDWSGMYQACSTLQEKVLPFLKNRIQSVLALPVPEVISQEEKIALDLHYQQLDSKESLGHLVGVCQFFSSNSTKWLDLSRLQGIFAEEDRLSKAPLFCQFVLRWVNQKIEKRESLDALNWELLRSTGVEVHQALSNLIRDFDQQKAAFPHFYSQAMLVAFENAILGSNFETASHIHTEINRKIESYNSLKDQLKSQFEALVASNGADIDSKESESVSVFLNSGTEAKEENISKIEAELKQINQAVKGKVIARIQSQQQAKLALEEKNRNQKSVLEDFTTEFNIHRENVIQLLTWHQEIVNQNQLSIPLDGSSSALPSHDRDNLAFEFKVAIPADIQDPTQDESFDSLSSDSLEALNRKDKLLQGSLQLLTEYSSQLNQESIHCEATKRKELQPRKDRLIQKIKTLEEHQTKLEAGQLGVLAKRNGEIEESTRQFNQLMQSFEATHYSDEKKAGGEVKDREEKKQSHDGETKRELSAFSALESEIPAKAAILPSSGSSIDFTPAIARQRKINSSFGGMTAELQAKDRTLQNSMVQARDRLLGKSTILDKLIAETKTRIRRHDNWFKNQSTQIESKLIDANWSQAFYTEDKSSSGIVEEGKYEKHQINSEIVEESKDEKRQTDNQLRSPKFTDNAILQAAENYRIWRGKNTEVRVILTKILILLVQIQKAPQFFKANLAIVKNLFSEYESLVNPKPVPSFWSKFFCCGRKQAGIKHEPTKFTTSSDVNLNQIETSYNDLTNRMTEVKSR